MSAFAVARISNTPGEEELEQLFNSVWKGYDVDLVSPVEGSISGGGSDAASSYTRSWQDSPTSPESANSYAPGVSPNQPLPPPPPPPPPTSTLPPPPTPPLPVAAAPTSSSSTPPAHTPTTAVASESGKSTPSNGRARRPLPPTPGRPSSSGTPAAPPATQRELPSPNTSSFVPVPAAPPIPPPVVPPPSQLPEPESVRELEPVPEPDPQPESSVDVIPPQHRALEESHTPPGSASAAGPSSTTSSPWSLRPRGIPLDLVTGPAIAIHHDTAPLSPAPEYFKEVEDDPEATAVLSEDDPRYSQPPPEPYPFPLHQPHEPTVPIAESSAHTWSRSSVTGYGEDPYETHVRSPSAESQLAYLDPSSSRGVSMISNNNIWNPGLVMDISIGRMNSTSTTASRAYSDDRNQAGPSNILERIRDFSPARDPLDRPDPLLEDEEWSEDEEMFINFSLLSNLAVLLRDKVPRGTHVKGSIPYPRAFTGRDIVSAIQGQIQRELVQNHAGSTNDRRAALQVARSLQSQLFFYEVEWGSRELQDGVEDVYMFLDDEEGASSAPEREELPTGVVTVLTSCYSPMCDEGIPCYSSRCPRKGYDSTLLPQVTTTSTSSGREEWVQTVPAHVIESLDEMEISRQTIIHKIISKEEQYIQDLDIVDTVFIKALRMENPPVLPRGELDEFIEEVFYNILDLRECNKRLLEVLYVRQREESPVIKRIGDIFLDVATEFRLAYPDYIGHHPIAEKRMRDELDNNPKFRLFIEKCSRKQSARPGERRLDLKHFLNRPVEHLQKYPVLLDAVISETTRKNPDREFLLEASTSISNLQNIAQLRTFQSAMGKGSTTWHSLVPSNELRSIPSGEQTRQSVIFELIKGEMEYVKDLENIENMYIRPLREAEPPIVPRDRLPQFIYDVFHNYNDLYSYHLRLVEKFHEIQREEHPRIRSITAPIFDAALNFREAYMEYIPNYPIAEYRIDDEKAKNPAFRAFLDECNRHPDARRLDMKNFINRPIPRLLRYELLLKSILEQTHITHEDSSSIPQVIEVIKALGKDTEPGVASAKQKVELWKYNSNLVFRIGETIDMDLLNEQRSLIHTGKLLRQPEGGLNSGWSELFVMLFDNYLVLTKAKEKDGVIRYHVTRRPIPLDLLSLVNFTDPSVQRGAGMLRNLRTGSERAADTVSIAASSRSAPVSSRSAEDSRSVYPFTIHHTGRLGGRCVLYAESATARQEWKQKLDEALGLRKVVQESNKVFEIETLSIDTFLIPSMSTAPNSPAWSDGTMFTGKATCSVPFNTPDGRGLVAIGCAEGVWIGFRHDSRSMRRVLHLKMVTQCAILEDFGLFLVLADKALFAYHIEALVPTTPNSVNTPQTPQKLNGSKDVQFFSVGTFHGRTLLVYMRKRGTDSVFRVVEPVIDKINEKPKASGGLFPKFGRSSKAEWFRDYREFFLPCDAYDLVFLKAKIAILCTKGFEIMDMAELSTVTIPQRDDARLAHIAKRCETARPLGMFRHTDDEFLLCYDEFGIFVNKHGTPSRSFGTIEWEGTAERVALHAPYILLFDPRFIEVRHLDTGRLAQIIPGKDVRCIWDGRGVDSSLAVTPAEGSEENMVQEPRVHAVMSITEPVTQPNGRPLRGTAQHVFELVPTIPLYLPGSLASPTTGTYFPRTFSPPRSPSLRPTTSYRS